MKKYILNNVEISADEIRNIVKNNPEIMEEKKEGRFFSPEDWEDAYYLIVHRSIGTSSSWEENEVDQWITSMWVYKTKEQVEKEIKRRKALVRIWKRVEDNGLLFEPDWEDERQEKHDVHYDHESGEVVWCVRYTSETQFELPYFKTSESREKAIKECEEDYLIYFGKK